MIFKSGNLNKLIVPLLLFLMALNNISGAPVGKMDSTLNNLYENLLQREYAGPISFPDHQVERKAQRSPSLRLRFGRSDPDMLPMAEKRWFGDVNQKPIRSPSLRLRFGRRSDPMMNDNEFLNNYLDSGYLRYDEKEKRKPSGRLRWGRSSNSELYNNLENYLSNVGLIEKYDDEGYPMMNEPVVHDLHEPLLESESLQTLLKYLQGYDENQQSRNEFEREIRKPAPLRLRWGRSTGGIQKIDEQQKSIQPEFHNQLNKESENTKQIIKA